MAGGYSWSDAKGEGFSRLPGPDRLGWWAAVAMVISVILHVTVFFALDRMKIALGIVDTSDIRTDQVHVQQVEVRPYDPEPAPAPENVVIPPTNAAALIDEIDLLDMLPKDKDIDIKPDVDQAEYALQMVKPAASGDPEAIALEVTKALEIDTELPDFGRRAESLPPAAVGQVIVDPGGALTEGKELDLFTDDLIKRGARGKVDKGALDGLTSLDDLMDMPANELVGKKTMLPSDLLFEFNSSDLRESAKVGLYKLGLLMDRQPDLYCWIEGHTDLIGGDEFNLELSRRRAEAVRTYLVEAMRMDGKKIVSRGFGRYQPLVIEGDRNAQASNRRVEIKLRSTPPPDEPITIPKAPVIEAPPAPKPVMAPEEMQPPKPTAPVQETPPPRAVLVKPKRILPPEELAPSPTVPPPLRATPVPEQAPAMPRAVPVTEAPQIPATPLPKALPVEESPPPPAAIPRAEPIQE